MSLKEAISIVIPAMSGPSNDAPSAAHRVCHERIHHVHWFETEDDERGFVSAAATAVARFLCAYKRDAATHQS